MIAVSENSVGLEVQLKKESSEMLHLMKYQKLQKL